MKRQLLKIVCPLLIAASLPALSMQNTTPNSNGPQLSFISQTLDLGVFNGDSIQHGAIQFVNTGTDTLRIFRIFSECGCTVGKTSRVSIAPGETDTLAISFDGRGRSSGFFKKVIRLRTNAGIKAAFVKGTIQPVFHH